MEFPQADSNSLHHEVILSLLSTAKTMLCLSDSIVSILYKSITENAHIYTIPTASPKKPMQITDYFSEITIGIRYKQ
jgi:hypothetical protein